MLLAPLPAAGQQATKIHRVGFLATSSRSPYNEAFLKSLRELGYVEGQNLAVEFRFSGERVERFSDLAAELVRLKVDIIYAATTLPAQAAKKATTTIPIVFGIVADPIGAGLVASLARPGGNVTGLTNISPELSGKRLELLKETFPRIRRVAVLLNPANPTARLKLKESEGAARSLGLKLHTLEARDSAQLDSVFSALMKERADALVMFGDPVFTAYRGRIVELAAKNRLPAMYEEREWAVIGGLMAYGPNLIEQVRRAVFYVDKILKGAKPADLPVEQPTKFELVINLKTAKALGLTIPQSVLVRADEVIR